MISLIRRIQHILRSCPRATIPFLSNERTIVNKSLFNTLTRIKDPNIIAAIKRTEERKIKEAETTDRLKGIPAGELAYLTSGAFRSPGVNTPVFFIKTRRWGINKKVYDTRGVEIKDYRVAVVASKKAVAKSAVTRRKLMRKIRAIMKEVLVDAGVKRCDYVLILRPNINSCSSEALKEFIRSAIASLKIQSNNKSRPKTYNRNKHTKGNS